MNNTPKDRVRIFRRDGSAAAEFRAKVERSWAIGDEGRAQFVYPSRVTDIVNEDVLQFGNWLLVENDSLPAWVGVIDTPRTWGSRTVKVCAYTPEHVFGWRRGPYEVVINGSAGEVFEYILSLVNMVEPTVIVAGDVDKSGINRQETINPTHLDTDLARIFERSGEEYQWRAGTDLQGRLVVYADWMNKIGQETTALLHEGKGGGNIEAVENVMVEDGKIFNDILGYGDGLTWVSKAKYIVTDQDSIYKYGLRQTSKYFDGVTSAQTLSDNSYTMLNSVKEPSRKLQLRALNVGNTFDFIGLGNKMNLSLQSVGFQSGGLGYEAQIRIIGMRYDPANKNKIELTVEVVQ